jgi:regulatory protein
MKITEILFNQRSKLYTLVLEQKETLTVYEDTLVQFELKKGLELTDEEWETLKHVNQVAAAVQYVCYYLLNTPRTEKGIKDKLRLKEYPKNIIDEALVKLNRLGYIQDQQFADAYIEGNKDRKSPRVIRQKLLEKGVSQEMADSALSNWDLEENLDVQIRNLIHKKIKSYKDLPEKELKDKLLRHLIYKGYGYEAVKGIVEEVLRNSEV